MFFSLPSYRRGNQSVIACEEINFLFSCWVFENTDEITKMYIWMRKTEWLLMNHACFNSDVVNIAQPKSFWVLFTTVNWVCRLFCELFQALIVTDNQAWARVRRHDGTTFTIRVHHLCTNPQVERLMVSHDDWDLITIIIFKIQDNFIYR